MPENLSPELLALRVQTQQFVDATIRPLEASLAEDAEQPIPQEIAQKVREEAQQLGLFYKTQPAEFGGQPAGTLELTMLRELLAAANLRLSQFVFGPGPGALGAAQGEVKSKYLDAVLRGEKRGAFGFTEPDTAKRPTWAKREGDYLLVTGRKSFVTGGATADFISVLVNVEADESNAGGTAMVIIDREAEGVEIERRFDSLDGSGHASLAFNQVRVPVANVIGKIGEGMPRALGNIGNVRLSVSAQATGICMWVIDFVSEHLLAPHRSGTPLGQREGVRLRYADMRIETYAARSMLYRTARLAESGQNVVNETIATKVFCTETAGRVVDAGVQLVGGQALVHGHPLERLYRQVRSMRLMEGASDLLRINLVKGRLELDKGRL
ncbi:MAG: acyl-CoA dehydrogenase family protein [Pseudomonadales bacterium]|jgi:alkylation response protein AidB-like acyl-CoA dehydrogenase|nr:acyl-CoA dehydrogenase family protein [Pseudomonadales bacterium]MDP7596397.1 acyl-CoA dehydrogenase family protein [Pseudomonadales bacterium]HJN50127.1 acyl-CoA dehydrogenase family protein [Pseudomonadales bacterium]|tara:strand:- start:661 stop:1809 length:1149 start_codon:yes stop_codon:yes gene_type:complete